MVKVLLPDQDQAVGLRVGQRSEQDAVYHAENRRVGPDSQGQREHDHRCEPGNPPEGAKGHTKVVEHGRHLSL